MMHNNQAQELHEGWFFSVQLLTENLKLNQIEEAHKHSSTMRARVELVFVFGATIKIK